MAGTLGDFRSSLRKERQADTLAQLTRQCKVIQNNVEKSPQKIDCYVKSFAPRRSPCS
jgi:hypothetical protein